MNFTTDYIQTKKENLDHSFTFSPRTMDEIWSSSSLNLTYTTNDLKKLWESKDKNEKVQEKDE